MNCPYCNKFLKHDPFPIGTLGSYRCKKILHYYHYSVHENHHFLLIKEWVHKINRKTGKPYKKARELFQVSNNISLNGNLYSYVFLFTEFESGNIAHTFTDMHFPLDETLTLEKIKTYLLLK